MASHDRMPVWTTVTAQWNDWDEFHSSNAHYWATRVNDRVFGVFARGEVDIPILDDPLPPKVGIYEIFSNGWDWHHPIVETDQASLDDALHVAKRYRERLQAHLLEKLL
jgi:hypothetical protein